MTEYLERSPVPRKNRKESYGRSQARHKYNATKKARTLRSLRLHGTVISAVRLPCKMAFCSRAVRFFHWPKTATKKKPSTGRKFFRLMAGSHQRKDVCSHWSEDHSKWLGSTQGRSWADRDWAGHLRKWWYAGPPMKRRCDGDSLLYPWRNAIWSRNAVMGSGHYSIKSAHGKLGPRDSFDQVSRQACEDEAIIVRHS